MSPADDSSSAALPPVRREHDTPAASVPHQLRIDSCGVRHRMAGLRGRGGRGTGDCAAMVVHRTSATPHWWWESMPSRARATYMGRDPHAQAPPLWERLHTRRRCFSWPQPHGRWLSMLQTRLENSHPRHLSSRPTVTPRIPLRVCHPSVSAGALLCTLQFVGAGHIASLHVTVPPSAMNPSDLDALPKAEKDELLSIIESMQTRDRCACPPAACPRQATALLRVCPSHALRRSRSSLRMYNGLVERCFVSCVDTFRRKTLEKSEEVVRPADHP
jgi:hypothetical protein